MTVSGPVSGILTIPLNCYLKSKDLAEALEISRTGGVARQIGHGQRVISASLTRWVRATPARGSDAKADGDRALIQTLPKILSRN